MKSAGKRQGARVFLWTEASCGCILTGSLKSMAPERMVRLDIGSLKQGLRTDRLTPDPADLGLDGHDFRDIRVTAHLDREGDRILVRLEVSGTARLQCDRTLVDYDQGLASSGSLLFVPAAHLEELGGPSDEVLELPAFATELDVTDAVRDLLLLSIPLRRIAPGAESIDLPTRFGAPAQEETDPRWEALKRLREGNTDRD